MFGKVAECIGFPIQGVERPNLPTPRMFRDLAPPFLHETDRTAVSSRQRLESAEREPAIAETGDHRFVQAQQLAFLGRVA